MRNAVIFMIVLLGHVPFPETTKAQSSIDQKKDQGKMIVNLHALLEEMIDRQSVARWPKPAFTMRQASSYDRHSVSPDQPGWFANDDQNQFIRTEMISGRTEYVMMDADGPGAIVRFWLTMQTNTGRLRIYFDHEKDASIQIEAYDLMKGGFDIGSALLSYHRPKMERGNTMYLPLPYREHCKVTFERTDTLLKPTPHYYHVNYRTYAKGTTVKTFTLDDLRKERATLAKVQGSLWNPPAIEGQEKKMPGRIISSRGSISFDLPEGSQAIENLTIKLSEADSEKLSNAWNTVFLKMEFDGQETVRCPLGDFAGSGFGGRRIKSWYREVDGNGQLTSRWVMPYKSKAKITLFNSGGSEVKADLNVTTTPWKWDESSLYFHVSHRFGTDIKDVRSDYDLKKVASQDSTGPIEWTFIDVKGKGIYLGNTLSVNNHMKSWYGEGDAKAWVDGSSFPVEFGTGLEDYYNTSWAPVEIYQTPFANAPRADEESSHGYNTFTRTRNLDGIPFEKSFRYNLEMLSWDGGTIDISSTVYWYGL